MPSKTEAQPAPPTASPTPEAPAPEPKASLEIGPLEGEGVAPSTVTAPAPSAVPAPAAQPTAPATPATGPTVDARMSALLQRLDMEAQARTRAEQSLQQLQNEREEEKYRAGLEQQGLLPDQIEGQVRHLRDLQKERAELQRERVAVAQMGAAALKEAEAKLAVAQGLAQHYGVAAEELMRSNDPYVMMANAKALAAEAKLAKFQQAAVQPVTLTSNQPGSVAPTSYDRLLDRYTNGERLNSDELKVLFPDRY